MARYMISFDAHAMDDIPAEDIPAVAEAAHEVAREAMNAGVWVFGGREEALKWAAKTAACRCAQEVREFGRDPAVGN
jgi:hypothetical protein